MKTASVQHLNTLVNHREFNADTLGLQRVSDFGTAVMKKLSNVNPFLLLLVPVLMMMAFSFAVNRSQNGQDQAMLKKAAVQETAKIAASYHR